MAASLSWRAESLCNVQAKSSLFTLAANFSHLRSALENFLLFLTLTDPNHLWAGISQRQRRDLIVGGFSRGYNSEDLGLECDSCLFMEEEVVRSLSSISPICFRMLSKIDPK